MTDEVITEDTPDNGVELLEHKMIMLKAVNEDLNKSIKLLQYTCNSYQRRCDDYEKKISRLVNNMTVSQLQNLGAKVTITFSNVDEDYD